MIRYVVLFAAFVFLVSMAFALLVLTLVLLAMACVVGIPLYLMGRRFASRHGISTPSVNPMERLRTLYVDGKIDLMEFERRVARLIAVER
jgi:hypothetical protein